LFVHWAEDVSFAPALVVRKHTETRLHVAPITLDCVEFPIEPTDCQTQTGNTEFWVREPLPPAEAA